MSWGRYPEYRESGVEWIGSVPAHWTLRRLGYYLTERREKVSDRDYRPLSVTKKGVVPQLETAAKTDDGDNRKRVCAGDFAINGRSDRKGSSGLSMLDGSVSLINIVLKPQHTINMHFVEYLLKSVPFQEEFYRFGKGIVADLWSTNFSEMRNILLSLPPPAEQAAIAAFLDRETGRIDALVAEQERLIALLKEKRQAVISHAVTRGLNPDAPMKDSGVAWLGEVPAHWEVKPIKQCLASLDQGWSPQCEAYPAETPDTWAVLKVGCVNGGTFNAQDNKTLPDALDPVPALALRVGDVLVSRANTRDLVGSAAVVPQDHSHLMVSDKLYRLRLHIKMCLSEFLCFFLNSDVARSQIELGAGGASQSMLNISQDVITGMIFPVPTIEEQEAIISRTKAAVQELDTLTTEATRAIALLRERRAALISAAVTGRIDVRAAVPAAQAAA